MGDRPDPLDPRIREIGPQLAAKKGTMGNRSRKRPRRRTERCSGCRCAGLRLTKIGASALCAGCGKNIALLVLDGPADLRSLVCGMDAACAVDLTARMTELKDGLESLAEPSQIFMDLSEGFAEMRLADEARLCAALVLSLDATHRASPRALSTLLFGLPRLRFAAVFSYLRALPNSILDGKGT